MKCFLFGIVLILIMTFLFFQFWYIPNTDNFKGGYKYSLKIDSEGKELYNKIKKELGEEVFMELVSQTQNDKLTEEMKGKIIAVFGEEYYQRLINYIGKNKNKVGIKNKQ